jgi:hypothetical protein
MFRLQKLHFLLLLGLSLREKVRDARKTETRTAASRTLSLALQSNLRRTYTNVS